MLLRIGFGFIGLFFIATSAYGRVFDYKDMRLAGYIRGTGGFSQLGQSAFRDSSGEDTAFRIKDDPSYNYSAEIGFLLQLGDNLSVRAGLEGVQSREITVPGFNTTGEKLMDVRTRVLALVPQLTLEFVFSRTQVSKLFVFAGAGYATVKGTNLYGMTTDGTTLYGNDSDKEAVTGTAYLGHGGFGYERLFVDNVTVSFEAGWRYLLATQLKHDNTVQTPTGTWTAGDVAVNNEGARRSLDLGGPYVGVSLRFYIPPLH